MLHRIITCLHRQQFPIIQLLMRKSPVFQKLPQQPRCLPHRLHVTIGFDDQRIPTMVFSDHDLVDCKR